MDKIQLTSRRLLTPISFGVAHLPETLPCSFFFNRKSIHKPRNQSRLFIALPKDLFVHPPPPCHRPLWEGFNVSLMYDTLGAPTTIRLKNVHSRRAPDFTLAYLSFFPPFPLQLDTSRRGVV